MIKYKERPYSRKAIENLCKEYHVDLDGLLRLHGDNTVFLSSALLKQIKKMLQENVANKKKESLWIEVNEIPHGTLNENKLLIPGHKFIKAKEKKM